MKLYPYKMNSTSGRSLAKALGIKRLRSQGVAIKAGPIINWGSSCITRKVECPVMNIPEAVAKAVNKLEAFKAMEGRVDIPPFTTDAQEASKWLAKGGKVVCRHKLTGHSGEGIEIVENGELPQAKLYVKYIPKKDEYRLHVFHDEVFFVQRKARSKEVADDKVNWLVRNHRNGFIYAHKDVDVPFEAKQAAIMAIAALGLDFGAVDMIYNEKHNKYYVLEVNTACGLYGQTLEKYKQIFQMNGEDFVEVQ